VHALKEQCALCVDAQEVHEVSVSFDRADGRVTVRLGGEFDLATAPGLREVLAESDTDTVVDLAEVSFIDSSTLQVFVTTHLRLGERGHNFVLRNPRANVRRVLEVTGLDKWIEDG
jgi:anti-anti-sigma factor